MGKCGALRSTILEYDFDVSRKGRCGGLVCTVFFTFLKFDLNI